MALSTVDNRYSLRQLGPDDLELMDALLDTFGEVFDQQNTYAGNRPDGAYTRRLLGGDTFIAVVAMEGERVVGGLTAYELKKFEQPRSEIYLYDLAVAASYRRRGIATALIDALKRIGAERGTYVIFVQADTGVEDAAAIALYSKLGVREEVLHFDIPVADRGE